MSRGVPQMSAIGGRLAAALAGWLPQQRWFAGKGRALEGVRVAHVIELVNRLDEGGPAGFLVVATVSTAGGSRTTDRMMHYQIPLGVRRDDTVSVSSPITVLEGLTIYDATEDAELMRTVLDLIVHDRWRGKVWFHAEASLGEDGEPSAEGIGVGSTMPVRRVDGEQSNTSVVFDDRYILKLFRRLVLGTNPELEIHRGLKGAPQLARHLGSIEADLRLGRDTGSVTLGVLQSFVPGALDGWQWMTAALDALVSDQDGEPGVAGAQEENANPPTLVRLELLGRAVADLHERLASAFGSADLTPVRAAELRDVMTRRLLAAVREVPALAPMQGRLRRIYDGVRHIPGERVQRVHGDLHLGQVLWSEESGWVVIDFEGEPGAPIDQRSRWRSPAQDVAGMLRSLDYAAGVSRLTARSPEQEERLRTWTRAAKGAFLRGYGEVSDLSPKRRRLLRAYEADKAVYETVYEARNRPEWIEIPLNALRAWGRGEESA